MNSLLKWISLLALIVFLPLVGCGGTSTPPTPIPTYLVTYSGNGQTSGNIPAAPTPYPQASQVTVLGNAGNLAKTGYAFAGWNTDMNGGGTTYSPGQTFVMGAADVTLYAVWSPLPTHGITYNGNGQTAGTPPLDASHYLEGQTVTVLGNIGNLAKTGYAFAGWNTQADGAGTMYSSGQTLTMGAADVILYARWTALPTHTVTYNGNGSTGGSVPMDGTHYLEGQAVIVLGNTGSLVKTGQAFQSWNTRADGTGTAYAPAQTFAMGTVDVVLYAQWAAQRSIYISGDESLGGGTSRAVYWINDGTHMHALPGASSTGSCGFAIMNHIVYTAGSADNCASLWRGDTADPVHLGGTTSKAFGITAANNKIYVAGRENNQACYWVDDGTTITKIALATAVNEESSANAIAVFNGEVYLGGWWNDRDAHWVRACYWMSNGPGRVIVSTDAQFDVGIE
ncbi:MAG: InlB B-repeat-containing protein, partial [Firmicutes bacterium]|nr:InlB B-repeat-containing protein [Bacillota bacterium]